MLIDKTRKGNTMTNARAKQHFIPYRKADIIEMCLTGDLLPVSLHQRFRDFCRILESVFHFEFHTRLETIKNAYAPFNPDADTRRPEGIRQEGAENAQAVFIQEMREVLNAANYEPITEADIQQALHEESLFKVRLAVDFNDFDEVLFFQRGAVRKKETLVQLKGLRKKEIEFTNFERVVVYVKFKEEEYFSSQNRNQLMFKPGSSIIKLFQNVPKGDLEMLFPNSQVRMKTIDKLLIGIPAAVSGVAVIATKVGASLLLIGSLLAFWAGFREEEVEITKRQLTAMGAGMAALAAYFIKQFNKFKNRKIKFMKALAENLYFKNLDNNAGVFHHLIDAAEEEEFKEAVLAYLFLLRAEAGLSQKQLDHQVEQWFDTAWGCSLDFEVDDALAKLERLDLVEKKGDKLVSKPLPEAMKELDRAWDGYFNY